MTQINIVDANTLKSWLDDGQAVLVDVREECEYRAERIEGATLIPLSAFDVARLPDSAGRKLVLQCKAGVRSASACEIVVANGAADEVWNLIGGIDAWKQAGHPVI